MNIYLMIKRHKITGLKYFCKTHENNNPQKYKGSGKYWKSHIKKHGIDQVETLWYKLFDVKTGTRFARLFSRLNKVVTSKTWANLVPELGTDGNGTSGKTLEEVYQSKEKADSIKKKQSIASSRSYVEKYGDRADTEREKRRNSMMQSIYHSSGMSRGINNGNAKSWVVVSPKDEIFDLGNEQSTLVDFCSIHKLSSADMGCVASGKLNHHKTWICFYKENFNENLLKEKIAVRNELAKLNRNRHYKIVMANGESFVFEKIEEICDFLQIKSDMVRRFLESDCYEPKIKKYKRLAGIKIETVPSFTSV